MKRLKSILSVVLLIQFAVVGTHAQLVNGSFENYVNLPLNLGEWQVVDGWNNCESMLASPDYYHYLANSTCDIPQTPMAMVNAADGEAVMGIIACGRKHTNVREYLCNEFSTPLTVGTQYNFEFKIANGQRTSVSSSGLAVSDLGFYFSVAQPVQSDYSPLNVTPQFKIDTVFYSQHWKTISFAFTASQPYAYMTFGVFGDDTSKEIEVFEGVDPAYAYYFVDGFKLQPVATNYNPMNPLPNRGGNGIESPVDSSTPAGPGIAQQPFFIPNSFTPNNDGFNEEFKPVKGLVCEWDFEIYSPWGERVFATNDEDLGWDGYYNGSPCNVGTYVWQISYRVQDEFNEWRNIVEKGVFTLIR